ncbi:hypothetical protein CAPTEDRAFT_207233 [Capitella teleta]|uniref:Chitin-binding type-2 domain-containing protein n=1 Tax=Capitella teleta TaxID=283909 RepID=R7VHJ6_CAPTE|nr:hypothetical protein CAPTEDRAFT_207233 [Capitella teleta]|eukprot:ELU18089.1 hypothetical protein CAPTEDRAFT_207233 [Capitella teleta]
MKLYLTLVALATLSFHEAYAQIDCTDLEDGVYGWGCKGYTRCEGGEGTNVDCTPDVFNEEIMDCDDPENVGPPCGLFRDCSELEDGMYADLHLNCTAFYTCQDGIFFGHNPCNPGTVFNEELQVCDFPENVPPPCGTKEEQFTTVSGL